MVLANFIRQFTSHHYLTPLHQPGQKKLGGGRIIPAENLGSHAIVDDGTH